jgi:hypothetical protein
MWEVILYLVIKDPNTLGVQASYIGVWLESGTIV